MAKAKGSQDQPEASKKAASPANGNGRLAAVDLSLSLKDKQEYEALLEQYQQCLIELESRMRFKFDRGVLVAIEGWDAAGKGGAIKRLTEQLDPRFYRVVATRAPQGEERVHHYLWRFWRDLPRHDFMVIFDRTWYGRVLVERIEGFARPEEWQRAYQEINEFERQLVDDGTVLIKLFLHISKDEQKRRFEDRLSSPLTAWKVTDEDWRNREKWDEYVQAYDDMLARCDTPYAPWTVVAGNNKWYARVQVLSTIVERLAQEVG